MKSKKIIALILSLLMCSHVYASEGVWNITFSGTDKPQGETYYAEYSTDSAYDGATSLEIVYPNSKIDSNMLEVEATIPESLEAGTYDLKFYLNKTGANRGCSNNSSVLEVAGESHLFNTFTTQEVTEAPSGESGWICYSKQITISESSEGAKIKFIFVGPVRGCYIDSVTLSPTGENDNLIPESGFEIVVEKNEVYDWKNYTPYDVITTYTTNGGLAISWKNPPCATIKDIKLYDITDGGENLIADKFNKGAKEVNVHVTEALTAGKAYQYKLCYSFDDITDIEYFITDTAKEAGTNQIFKNIGKWEALVNHSNSLNPYALHDVIVDTTEKHSGEAALKFITNTKSIIENTYLAISTPIATTAGKDYQLSFWVKADNSEKCVRAHMNWKFFDAEYVTQSTYINGTEGTYPWKQVVVKKSDIESGASRLNFNHDFKSDAIWIDDIELKLLDEDGNPTGKNLVSGGDFEDLLTNENGQITELSAEDAGNAIKLIWTSLGSDVKRINLYQKIGDSWGYRGSVDNSISGVMLKSLKYDKEYEFKAVAVNADGAEGEEKTTKFTVTAPDYVVSDTELIYNAEAVDEISGSGEYIVKTDVKNNSFEDGMNYEMLVAVFENGEFYNLLSKQKNIAFSTPNANPTTVSISVLIPEEAKENDYSIKVYHIDSREKWNVLKENGYFK